MKKGLFFIIVLIITSQIITSCKARKPRCPAYGQSTIEQVEEFSNENA